MKILGDYKKVIIYVLIAYGFSITLPFVTLFALNPELGMEVNPTVINGILTATAIVFGFVTFELREIKTSMAEKLILSMPLLFFIMLTTNLIFYGIVLGKMTVLTATVATSNFFFNIFYIFPVMAVKYQRNG